jgi:conjugative transfer pilus assembly protein TraH
MSDLSEAWSWGNEETTSPTKELKNNDPSTYKDKITVNVAWKTFKEAQLDTLFAGDDDVLEAIMTITGSVIINDDDSDPKSDPKLTTYEGYGIKLTDLIEGGALKVYKCNDTSETGCLDMNSAPSKTVNVTGFKDMVEKSLIGTDGIISAYKNDTEWSDTAKKVLSIPTITGDICLKKIYQASVAGKADTIGNSIASACSDRMALEMAYNLVSQYLYTATASLSSASMTKTQQKAKEEAQKIFQKSFDSYRSEYMELAEKSSADKLLKLLELTDFNDGTSKSIVGGN